MVSSTRSPRNRQRDYEEESVKNLESMLDSVQLDGKIVEDKVDELAFLIQKKLNVDLGPGGYKDMAEQMMKIRLEKKNNTGRQSPRKHSSKGTEPTLDAPTWSQDSSSPEPELPPNAQTRQTMGNAARSPMPHCVGEDRGRSPARTRNLNIPRPNRSRTPVGSGAVRGRPPTPEMHRSQSPAVTNGSKSPFRVHRSRSPIGRFVRPVDPSAHGGASTVSSPSIFYDAKMNDESIVGGSPLPQPNQRALEAAQANGQRPDLNAASFFPQPVDEHPASTSGFDATHQASATMPSANMETVTRSGTQDHTMSNVQDSMKKMTMRDIQFNIGIGKPASPFHVARSPSHRRQRSSKKRSSPIATATPMSNGNESGVEVSPFDSTPSTQGVPTPANEWREHTTVDRGRTPARQAEPVSAGEPFRIFSRLRSPEDAASPPDLPAPSVAFISPIPPFQPPEAAFAERSHLDQRANFASRRQTAPPDMATTARAVAGATPKTPHESSSEQVLAEPDTADTAVNKKGRKTATPYVGNSVPQFHVNLAEKAGPRTKAEGKLKVKRGLGFRRGLGARRVNPNACSTEESPAAPTEETTVKTPSSAGSGAPMEIDGNTPPPPQQPLQNPQAQQQQQQPHAAPPDIKFNIGVGGQKSPNGKGRSKRREKGRAARFQQTRSQSIHLASSVDSHDNPLQQAGSMDSMNSSGAYVGNKQQDPAAHGSNEADLKQRNHQHSMKRAMVMALREEGKSHYISKNYRSSIHTYTNAIKIYLADCMDNRSNDLLAVLLSNRAAGLLMVGACKAAAEDCQQALQYVSIPEFGMSYAEGGPVLQPKLYNRMARALIKLGRVDSAEQAFGKAVESANTALLHLNSMQGGGVQRNLSLKGLEQVLQEATLGQTEVSNLREVSHKLACAQAAMSTIARSSAREKTQEALGHVNTGLVTATGCDELHGQKVILLATLKRWREVASHSERLATERVRLDRCFIDDLVTKDPFSGISNAKYLDPSFFVGAREDEIQGAVMKLNSKAVAEAVLRLPASIVLYYVRSLRLEERYPAAEAAIHAVGQNTREHLSWLPKEQDRLSRTKLERERGDEYFRRGEFTKAAAKYALCLTIDQEDSVSHGETSKNGGRLHAVLHCNRAACLMAERKYQDAITECTAALRIHPRYMKALLRRARCYKSLNRQEEATSEFKRWLEMVHQAKTSPHTLPLSLSPCLFDGPHEATEADIAQVRLELDEVVTAKAKVDAAARAERQYREQRQKWQNEQSNASAQADAQRRRDYFYSQQNSSSRRWDSFAGRGPKSSNSTSSSNMRNDPTGSHSKSPRTIAKEKDHYKVLDIKSDATAVEVKKGYRKLALKYHPDKNNDPASVDAFRRVNQAYEVLNDALSRRKYDTDSRRRRRF